MSRIASGSSLLVTLLIAASPVAAGEEIQLRYKMAKDQPLVYRTETSLKQTETVAGNAIETEFVIKEVARRTLDQIDDMGNFRVHSESKRLQVSMKIGPLGEYQFDSKSEKRDEGSQLGTALNPVYEKLKDAAITFTLSPSGEVSQVEGLKGLLEDVLKDNPLGAQLTGGISDESQKMGLGELFIQLSDKPVKPGDTWDSKYELNIPKIGKAEGKRTYTYEGPDKVGDRKTARIRVVHELAFDIDLDNAGVKVKGKMKIDQSSGVVQFDPEKGQIFSMDSTYKLSGDLNADAGGKLIPVKSEQEQNIKVELLDKLPE